ncbi:hypothetical protein [Parapedobacter sp. 10938]|uniref:hypothetical protein n=1 Tax=Parapedobacter flavus TaxID=3110225 RepID=UPI002DB6133E|nr:hypothetical protein [Parapedobacter sp. 10938]MEC3881995.1 hypothetical protein [Parapedobacter sp. 10938]
MNSAAGCPAFTQGLASAQKQVISASAYRGSGIRCAPDPSPLPALPYTSFSYPHSRVTGRFPLHPSDGDNNPPGQMKFMDRYPPPEPLRYM